MNYIAIEKTMFGYAGLTEKNEVYIMKWIGGEEKKLDSYHAGKFRHYFKKLKK